MQNLPHQLTPQSQSPMQMSAHSGQMDGYNQIPEEVEEPQKIIAHFGLDELQDLDQFLLKTLQEIYKTNLPEDILFDPDTGLRNYTPLDTILKEPEIYEALSSIFSQSHQKFAMGGEVNQPGRPIDPELEKLRLEGRHGDTELAIITPFLLETFSKWKGREPDINPITGLPEFGGVGSVFKTIARVGGAIVGGIFGGPMGAALGAGLATKLTGGSWGQSLGAGAMGGLGAGIFGGLGGGASGSGAGGFLGRLPGIGNLFGGMGGGAGGGFLGNIGSGIGNFLGIGGGAAPGVVGADTVGRMLPGSAFGQNLGQAAMQAAGQTGGGGFLGNILGGSGGGAGGGGGLLSSLSGGIGKALPLIGSSLLMAKGHKDEQKSMREYQQSLEAKEQREKAENEAMRERMGFNAKLNPIEPYRRRQINPNITPEQYSRGVAPSYFENYAEGGAIRGDGKGQQDNIPMDIKDGSYIFDASTVSDIGDGSSNAGIKELDRYFSRIPSQQDESGAQGYESKGGYIQAMVSNDEYRLSPEKVTAIGGGSNKKGAQILKKFVEEIREKKRTSGKRLPPKSKPIGGYLKSINRNAA